MKTINSCIRACIYSPYTDATSIQEKWGYNVGTSAEGRGETGEKRDGEEKRDREEKTCMPKIRLACLREDLFPSLYTSSPAFTPLPQPLHLFTKTLHLFTKPLHLFACLCMSISKIVRSYLVSKSENG